MRNVLIGIGISLLFVCALLFGWEAWRMEQTRAVALASYQWLSEPVLEVEGKKYSRAQVLDLLMVKALKVEDGNTKDNSR